MNKILQATSRGQVTLPKDWRDKFGTQYYMVEVNENELVIKPMIQPKTFKVQVEDSWREYKEGDFVDSDELKKKYDL